VLSGSGLCDELIIRSEESYRLWRVVVCDLEISIIRWPWPTGKGAGGLLRQKQTNPKSKSIIQDFIYFIRRYKNCHNNGSNTFLRPTDLWKGYKFLFAPFRINFVLMNFIQSALKWTCFWPVILMLNNIIIYQVYISVSYNVLYIYMFQYNVMFYN
jgi:hypothetical protein